MKSFWLSDDFLHWEVLGRQTLPDSVLISPDESVGEVSHADAGVVYANAGISGRSKRMGLCWLRRFRREARSLSPVLVYSFESRPVLAREFRMLESGTPGIGFLRLPTTADRVEREMSTLEPLTEKQLQGIIRWQTELETDWRMRAHDLGSAVSNWPRNQLHAEQILDQWVTSIHEFAHDQVPAAQKLQDAIKAGTSEEIRAAIQQLEDSLCSRPECPVLSKDLVTLPEAPYKRPPY